MANDNGAAQAEAAVEFKKSVKKDDYTHGTGDRALTFVIPAYSHNNNGGSYQSTFTTLPEHVPPYNRYSFFSSRDVILTATPHMETGWSVGTGIAITKGVTFGWSIETKSERLKKFYQNVIKYSTAGVFVGYTPFLQAHLRGFLNTGKGIIEIERKTKAYGSKIVALHHLNPLRCLITDDPDTPVLYMDRIGRIHGLRQHQVMLIGDMLDSTEGEYALVQSAAERAFDKIILMASIERYLYEKVGGVRSTALHFLQGVTPKHMELAISTAEESRERKGFWIYKGVSVIPIPGQIPLNLVTVPLSEIPDGFEPQNLRDDATIAYAGALGIDVNDLDPRLGKAGGIGTGSQALVLADKAKGKGLAAWRKQFAENMNLWVTNQKTTFVFTEEDLRDKKEKADINKIITETTMGMVEKGILTIEQGVNRLVDQGVLPQDFVFSGHAGGNKVEDTEKPKAGQNGRTPTEKQPPTQQQAPPKETPKQGNQATPPKKNSNGRSPTTTKEKTPPFNVDQAIDDLLEEAQGIARDADKIKSYA